MFPASSNPPPGATAPPGLQVPPAQRALPDAPDPSPLTLRDGRGQCGLAVVHMADGAHVHMGLVAHIDLLGLHGQAAAQAGQCRGLQRPQQTLQQWGRAGAETCQGRGLESGRRSEPGRSRRPPTWPRATIAFLAPSPLKRGVARSRVVAAIVVVLAPRAGRPRVRKGKGTGDWR